MRILSIDNQHEITKNLFSLVTAISEVVREENENYSNINLIKASIAYDLYPVLVILKNYLRANGVDEHWISEFL